MTLPIVEGGLNVCMPVGMAISARGWLSHDEHD
jgi:hypothetical protein